MPHNYAMEHGCDAETEEHRVSEHIVLSLCCRLFVKFLTYDFFHWTLVALQASKFLYHLSWPMKKKTIEITKRCRTAWLYRLVVCTYFIIEIIFETRSIVPVRLNVKGKRPTARRSLPGNFDFLTPQNSEDDPVSLLLSLEEPRD